MNRQSKYRRLLLALIVCIPLAAGIAGAGQEDMDITVNFYTRWETHRARLYVSLRWTPPKGNIGAYELYADGEYIGGISKHATTGSGYVVDSIGMSLERFKREVPAYLSKPHTYTLRTRRPPGGSTIWDEFEYLPPHVLRIQNWVEGFSELELRTVEIRHAQDAAEDRDETDLDYAPGLLPRNANIVSTRWEPEAESDVELEVDARPLDSTTDVYLHVSLSSGSGDPLTLPSGRANTLRFNFAYSYNDFGSGPITIQQYDPADPSRQYPIYDVRNVLRINDGVMPLSNLEGSYESGVPYAHFRLSFVREASRDLYEDQRFDLRDFGILARYWRTVEVPSIADTAGPLGPGLPDRRVDGLDLQAFCREWAGVLREDFEADELTGSAWVLAGFPFWKITAAQSHGGTQCVRAGAIGDNGSTTIMTIVPCRAGTMSFWRKVSSEAGDDFLRFKIDGTVQGQWSGKSDWERISFPVKAGMRAFAWEYIKDASSSGGDDTAWIDDVMFPVE